MRPVLAPPQFFCISIIIPSHLCILLFVVCQLRWSEVQGKSHLKRRLEWTTSCHMDLVGFLGERSEEVDGVNAAGRRRVWEMCDDYTAPMSYRSPCCCSWFHMVPSQNPLIICTSAHPVSRTSHAILHKLSLSVAFLSVSNFWWRRSFGRPEKRILCGSGAFSRPNTARPTRLTGAFLVYRSFPIGRQFANTSARSLSIDCHPFCLRGQRPNEENSPSEWISCDASTHDSEKGCWTQI